MGTTHFTPPYSSIQESDVRVVARVVGMSRGALLICSECLSGKEILNELESHLRTVQTKMGTIHVHRDGGSFVIDEIGENAFSFDIVESPADRFVAVIAYIIAERSDESDYEWRRYGEYVVATREAITINRGNSFSRCLIMDLPLDNAAQRGAEGFTFYNEELADIFRRCKYVEPPDYDTHLPEQYSESAWVTHLVSGATQTRTASNTGTQDSSFGSSRGCYVATAVYGSYDCPEVWTLRRFRDFSLARSWYGRAFIKVYYAVSPTLVKWFGQTAWFTKFWRGPLDRLVTRLKSEGYDDSPYND